MGVKIDPDTATVVVDGTRIDLFPDKAYIVLNKPRGYTSTRFDPHAKRTILDLVRDVPAPVYPVGRLDVDTEGLLILTNDGDFTFRLTHPSHELPKTYVAEVRGRIGPNDLMSLAAGIELEDGRTAPAQVKLLDFDRRKMVSVVELTIHEGRKRQVRRMFEALNRPVHKLARTRIGGVSLDDLPAGRWRRLTEAEVAGLLQAASLGPVSRSRTKRP